MKIVYIDDVPGYEDWMIELSDEDIARSGVDKWNEAYRGGKVETVRIRTKQSDTSQTVDIENLFRLMYLSKELRKKL